MQRNLNNVRGSHENIKTRRFSGRKSRKGKDPEEETSLAHLSVCEKASVIGMEWGSDQK